MLAGAAPNYLAGFNFNPNSYLSGQPSYTDAVSGMGSATQQYGQAATKAAQAQMQQALFGGNYQRQGLLGSIGAGGGMRSSMFGGAPAGRLQQFDTGLGGQVGQIGNQLNQELNSNTLQQQGTLADSNMQALQQAIFRQSQQTSPFDILGLGLQGLGAVAGVSNMNRIPLSW